MKLVRFFVEGAPRIGIAVGGGVVDVCRHDDALPTDMPAMIARWPELGPQLAGIAKAAADYALSDVRLLAPVARPGKILGIGLNYGDHVAESGVDIPTDQIWFSKPATAIAGPYDGIDLPKVSHCLDYEAELVAIMGAGGRHLSREDAAGAIFGYCVGNDVSVRDWQMRTTQFMLGKSFDTHAPIGPWIVTSDEIDPHALDIRSLVNDEVRQSSNTRHLIFDCYDQVAYLSQVMTLEPGDILFTGTPGGVGAAYKPPKWLVEGDRVRVEIEGIGHIENQVQLE